MGYPQEYAKEIHIYTFIMKLFVDKHYFISVLEKEEKYSCQVMELVHGMGMYDAFLDDEEQEDIVSSVVDEFDRDNKLVSSLQEVFNFHKEILLQL
jgi:hypothetical protein